MLRNRMWFGLVGLFLMTTANDVSAGPLWTFHATFGPTIGPGWLLYEPKVLDAPPGLPAIDPAPSYKFEFAKFGVSGVFEGPRLDFPVIGFTNATGAGVNHGPVPAGEPTDTQFRLTFGLTDHTSGERSSMDFTGRAVMEYRYDPTSGLANPESVDLQIEGLATLVWDLGENTYCVTLYDRFADGQDHLFASVEVKPNSPPPPPGGTVNTPEPGTFMLAGLGLAACSGVWLRRRSR